MYVTLKFDDNGSCRIHSVSDRDTEIVTNERYMVMPWKVVTRNGKNISLKEQLMGYLVVMNPRLKRMKKENERRERE